MYYEDENNLYHYSYRKGDKVENVRDVDYTEVPNTAAKADPWEEKKPKKNRLGLKIAALALACALIGGRGGAGITHHAFASARGSTQIEVSRPSGRRGPAGQGGRQAAAHHALRSTPPTSTAS